MYLIKRKTKGAIKLLSDAIGSASIKSYYRGIACIYRAYAHMVSSSFPVIFLFSAA